MARPRLVTRGVLTAFLILGVAVHPAAAQKKISVLTWNIPVYREKIDGWIEEFKRIHPDVQVEWLDKKGTEWATFYQTQVVGGTAPDIIDVQGALWLEYAANGGLVDLTPSLRRDARVRESYNPRFLATWVYEGKNYMVPFYVSKTLLFMNRTMMREAGLSRAPQTFDELMDAARKMTKGEKSGFMTLNFDWLYWSLFAMNGVELLTPDGKKAAFNTPVAVKALESLARATADGVINRISWTGRWVEPNGAFASGTVGFYQAHAPAFFYVKGAGPWISADTLGVAQMPGGFSTPNSHGLGISKSTKHPDIAWDFVKMVTGEQWAYTFGITQKVLSGVTQADGRILDYFQKEDPLAATVLRTHWEEFLLKWLQLMREARPEVSVRAESGLEPELMQGLIEGRIDIGVMYTPQSRPGLKLEQLFEEKLVMVSTEAKSKPEPQPGYVYVDWGPEFYARHSACFPNFGGPSLTSNIGWLGLQHVLENGGSGYFPERIVRPLLKAKRLNLVGNAPEFSMPAYVVYPLEYDRDLFSSALEIMHRIASPEARMAAGKRPARRPARKSR